MSATIAVAAEGPATIPASRWRAVFSLTTGALFGLVLGAALLGVVATRVLGFAVLTVESGSMAPAIEAGDAIVVRPIAIDEVEPGNVVVFESGGDHVPTVHRVVGINEVELNIRSRSTGETETTREYRLVTKGDANPAADAQTVTADRLRGEVWFTIPGGAGMFGLPMQWLLAGLAGSCTLAWLALEVRGRLRLR